MRDDSDTPILALARRRLRDDAPLALATVLDTWGSAPRRRGAMLLVDEAGDFHGSVSGGCVETAVIAAAQECIKSGRCETLRFTVSDDRAWEAGLACGGEIAIRVEPLSATGDAPLTPALLRQIEDATRRQESVALIRNLDENTAAVYTDSPGLENNRRGNNDEGHAADVAAHSAADANADAARPAATSRVATPRSAADTDAALRQLAARAITSDACRRATVAGQEFFIQPFAPPLRLLIVGAVHIAQKLVPLAQACDYAVAVIDPRQAFATRRRFPAVTLNTDWPDKALQTLRPDRRAAVVALSHDPKLDDPALRHALRSPAFYIGALGSRKTHQARIQRLQEEGLPPTLLKKIHAPIGLRIQAATPSEIAVSIMAEITEVLRKG